MMRSNQRRRSAARSLAVRAAQAGSAAAAAAIARRVSAAPMFGMVPSLSPVAGLCTAQGAAAVGRDPAAADQALLAKQRRSLSFKGFVASSEVVRGQLGGMCHGARSWGVWRIVDVDGSR